MGAYLGYGTVPYLMIALPVLFYGLFAMLPDTPQHLLRCDRVPEAERAWHFYRNSGASREGGVMAVNPNFERMKVAALKSGEATEAFRMRDLCE